MILLKIPIKNTDQRVYIMTKEEVEGYEEEGGEFVSYPFTKGLFYCPVHMEVKTLLSLTGHKLGSVDTAVPDGWRKEIEGYLWFSHMTTRADELFRAKGHTVVNDENQKAWNTCVAQAEKELKDACFSYKDSIYRAVWSYEGTGNFTGEPLYIAELQDQLKAIVYNHFIQWIGAQKAW